MGALEAEVLECLWSLKTAASPGDVMEAIDADLAYTTVMTILTRLWQKGLVSRAKNGRAYEYAPLVSEAELTAQRMQAHLGNAGIGIGITQIGVGGVGDGVDRGWRDFPQNIACRR